MNLKIGLKSVLITDYEEIKVGDTIRMMHKDGRPIRSKVTEIIDEMLYLGNEVVHIGQIDAIYIAEVI